MNIKEIIGEATEYEKKLTLEVNKPKSWLKTVSAFANGFGGMLLFGVDDSDNFVGLSDIKQLSESVSELIKTRMNPIPEVIMRVHRVEGKNVLAVRVLKGEETPYYYVGDGSLTAFKRIGNESVAVKPAELNNLVLRGRNTSYDSLNSEFELKDFAFSKLRAAYFNATGKSMTEKDFESFGIVTSKGTLTNAGALFADNSPVFCSMVFCTRWNGLNKASGRLDALDDMELNGSLISLLEDSISFVMRNNKKMWKKIANKRIEYPDYPERSVFESIVNALCHRDYLIKGSEVHIDIFDDRIEITSPGGMIDGSFIQNLDILSVPSMRRNPVIADIFSRLQFMERRGSGLTKIKENYKIQKRYSAAKDPVFTSGI